MSASPVELDLAWKGDRDYLHGTDIFQVVTRILRERDSTALTAFSMNLHSLVRTQPTLVFEDPSGRGTSNVERAATFELATERGLTRCFLHPSERRVWNRTAYAESMITENCVVEAARVRLRNDTGHLPIETIVAMTKSLHVEELRVARGKWLFTKLELDSWLDGVDGSKIEIALEANFHNRLTRSAIEIAGRRVGRIFFSLAVG